MAVVPKIKRKRRKIGPGAVIPPGKEASWRAEGWQPIFDAASLVEFVSDVVLAHTRDAIIAGQKPAGGEQVPLSPNGRQGREAKAGKRPKARGWTGLRTGFPLKIRRGKMRVLGVERASGPVRRGGRAPTVGTPTKATLIIRPSMTHRRWAQTELTKRGVEFLTADGEVAKMVDVAIDVWAEAAIAGETPDVDKQEKDADEVK